MIERIKLFLEDAAIPIIGGIAGSFIGMGIFICIQKGAQKDPKYILMIKCSITLKTLKSRVQLFREQLNS